MRRGGLTVEIDGIFDSHAHYFDRRFASEYPGGADALLRELLPHPVSRIINVGTNPENSRAAIAQAAEHPGMFAAAGIHPEDCEEQGESDIDALIPLLMHKKCVAIGEIGLDYHYSPENRTRQLLFFEKQLSIAKEFDLPVIIHDREAHADTLELLKKYRPKGVLHCFSGSAETAKEVVALGMYIGLGGAVTFKNARRPLEVAAVVPSDRLLLETDCPYMSPVPFRGKRNDSSLIPYAAEVIAAVRNDTAQNIINIAADNARTLFGL